MRSLESWPAGPRGAAGAELGGGQQGDDADPGNKYVDPVADADAAASQRGFAEGYGAKVSHAGLASVGPESLTFTNLGPWPYSLALFPNTDNPSVRCGYWVLGILMDWM